MSRQPRLCPKSHIPGYPNAFCDLAALASLSQPEPRSGSGEEKSEQRVFRVKRKHVLKACDRCRVKKTKCDGKQPCNRCSAHNHPCLFRERKATQTKVYSRGFVEMLESHHSLVVKALQKLYKLSLSKEGFPGEPLPEASDGYPLTHAILDRLGLIKQAEENPEDSNEDSEDLQYLRLLSTSTECSATADPSPEPATPPEPSSRNCSPVDLSPIGTDWKWNYPSIQTVRSEQYHSYSNQDFSGLAMSRTKNLTSDTSCLDTATTVLGHDHPYLYYLDTCNANAKESLGSCVNAGSGYQRPACATEMPVNMLVGGYDVYMQEQQPRHPPLVPGWSYPRE